ncbi:NUDIX hydrolase [Methylomonas sp. UP202]|uniref:NUDIX hydrolase n=1 Tax=Methylomonas sp. UP202 TaxID=3040943 RepID=UPI00247AC4FD|nr:NUDIX hydrolase [Methylomonas sp. UP202]WGS88595.1 NUDIX hydrolase [Methylomonas sp. UP202]
MIKDALPQTLKRELREEAGLLFGEHYHFQPWRSLKPYRQVQGAAPNHALTEYYLDIFRIELTLDGFLFLQQRIKNDSRLAWISLDDLVRGDTSDGKIPYIKALYDDFDGDRAALVAALAELPDSFVAGYLSDKDKFGITLPIAPGKPVLAGVLGKEKPLELRLNSRQLALVLGLAAHLRGFAFESLSADIVLHPFGWVEAVGKSSIGQELIELSAALVGRELVLESRRDCLFRLSIKPETVFFSDELFSFSVCRQDLLGVKNKLPATIERQSLPTSFGVVQAKTEVFNLTLEFADNLRLLSEQQFSTDNEDAVKIEDAYKKGMHKDTRFQALGLRNLIRREAGIFRFVLDYKCS